ncbi:MAG TPA: zinc ribbon domain-containing protein [Nitrososphaerales archaeon]|nr:zinc ribbon domain-containing protein [Nitrososphaerales archaeon]
MSDTTNRFCQRCGAELTPGAAFCPRCGNPVAGAAPPGAVPPPAYPRRRHEKEEKQEKHEKEEKGEKGGGGRGGGIIGSVVGGLILVWLGITFYLQQIGSIPSANWWAYFVAGIGVILIVQGLLIYLMRHRPFYGPFIGGALLFFVGVAFIYNGWGNFWPLIFVIIGIAILGSALARSRTPRPT